MGKDVIAVAEQIVRDISEREVETFRAQGWVKLDSLITRESAADLQSVVAEQWHALTLRPDGEATERPGGQQFGFFWKRPMADRSATFHAFASSEKMARNAARLMTGKRESRLRLEEILVKEPAGSAEFGNATDYHQDFPGQGIDRAGALTIWIALTDMPPEMGVMRFYEGSHKLGPLGRSFIHGNRDLAVEHEWLQELSLSPPLALSAGDATVHDSLTVHGAPENRTEKPRVAYVLNYVPADALYVGIPAAVTSGEQLKPPPPVLGARPSQR
jgi:ectoine hydroxylase-related dioxygenase (phytanoyl-CoA dioxygenase family)